MTFIYWGAMFAFAVNSFIVGYFASLSRWGPTIFFSLWSLYWIATAINYQPKLASANNRKKSG